MRRSQEAWNAYRSRKRSQKKRTELTILPKRIEISSLPQPVIHHSEVQRKRTGDRIGFIVSLSIHVLLFLFAIFYVIDPQTTNEVGVSVNIVQQAPQKPRIRRRAMPRILSVPSAQVKVTLTPRRVNVPTTAAQIPVSVGESTLPSLLSPSLDDDLALAGTRTWAALNRRVVAPVHYVETMRSPVVVNSSEPPRLEVTTETPTLASNALEFRELVAISPVIPLSEATRLPRFINKVIPRYPEMARRAGKEGVVILEAEIGTDGTSRDIQVVQGIGFGCDEAAIAALRASRFFPAYKGNRTVAVRIQIPYRFTFEDM